MDDENLSFDDIWQELHEVEDFVDKMRIDNIVRECMKKPGLTATRIAVREVVERAYRRWKEQEARKLQASKGA